MANFQEALTFVLKHEGGTYFYDPSTGEKSKWGITQKLLIGVNYGITDPVNLSMADVQNVYNQNFWQPNNLTSINSQLLANKIFDMMVNMGAFQAVKLLQASINSMGGQCVIDGKLGPHTMIVLNQCPDLALLEELRLKCVQFYKSIAIGNKAKYLAGWLKRAEDVGVGERDVEAYNVLRDGKGDKVIR